MATPTGASQRQEHDASCLYKDPECIGVITHCPSALVSVV